MSEPVPPLPALAGVADLKVWPGVLVDDDETAAAEAVLDTASTYVRLATGDPAQWPDPAAAPVAARQITVQVAARAWRNPSCAAMLTTGPFGEQFRRTVDDAVYLTDIEQGIVRKLVAKPALWTVSTCRDGDDNVPDGYDPFTGVIVPPSPYPSTDYLYGVA